MAQVDGKKVLVLGAGSAGLAAARTLKSAVRHLPGVEVTLVDRNNYHFVLPLIYQIVTGSVAPSHISFPIRPLFRGALAGKRVRFKEATILAIDPDARIVSTDAGDLRYDYLVLAIGSTTNFFGMQDVAENALRFKSVEDAIHIHNRIIENHEAALWEEDEQRSRQLLTFVVVGGGPTGVELAASIHDLTAKVLVRDYAALANQGKVILIEAQDKLLSGLKPRAGQMALEGLRSRGVEVMLNTKISEVGPEGVVTADGQSIPTNSVIWVAGIAAPGPVASLPFEKARNGQLVVNEFLEVPGAQGVYAVGDCAYSLKPDESGPYPPTHQVAIQQGPACAKNIVRSIKGEPRRPFRYLFKGQMVYMGRNMAVAQLGPVTFGGIAAAMFRRALYTGQILTYLGPFTAVRSKTSAMLDWLFSYFYNRNVARLE